MVDVAATAFHLLVLALELNRAAIHLAAAGRQLARHRVEGLHERSELVVALRFDPLIQTARADLPRGGRQHQDRTRDPLGEIRAHPGGAEENEQRHHQEERQIQAGQRTLQHAQLVVALERLGHPARARREIAREVRGRDDDAGRPAVLRPDDGGRVQQLARWPKRFNRLRVCRAGERLRRQTIHRRAAVPARQRRRGDVDHRFQAG
jgi:hypothetical protein